MKNNDNKEKFWKCEKCNLEHKIPTLFCDGCGAQRPEKEKIKIFLRNKISDNQSYLNIKLFDWFIMISAIVISAIIIVCIFSNNKFLESLIVWLLILPFVLTIIAFIRLFVCKYIFLWQRFIVLGISTLFNPIISIFILTLILSCFGPRGCMSKTNRTNKSKFVKACSEIVLNKNLYNNEYSNDFSELPEFIKSTKPVYVWINETNIKVAIIHKRPSYGWKFSQNTDGTWALYSYFENELNLLKSDIIINTNTGKVTIPWSFFN